MVQTADRLRALLAALDTDLLHQCSYLLLHPDTSLLGATWGGYQPAFTLDLQSAVFALAVGGALAGKRVSPVGLGTMRTDNATFVVLLIGVIILVGALTFFPALLLGPIVQALTGHLYR